MSELVEFIRGCLDADEQTARAATEGPWRDIEISEAYCEMAVARLRQGALSFGDTA